MNPSKNQKLKFEKHWSISWISFLWELTLIKTNQAFKDYAMSYKVEIMERKDPVVQLEVSKSSIKDFF